MRSKPLLTVLGRAEMRRAYYWCCRCQQGQFSTDAALDVENTELSPGVRRMLTLVGSECSSFERGREQMKLLAGLAVTTKAVERTTETSARISPAASRTPSSKHYNDYLSRWARRSR
jgi:hypothetical protein